MAFSSQGKKQEVMAECSFTCALFLSLSHYQQQKEEAVYEEPEHDHTYEVLFLITFLYY